MTRPASAVNFNLRREKIMSKQQLVRNCRGFTIVEMLIALLILSVSILALTGVSIMAIHTNLENDTRNAAVRLVSTVTGDLYEYPFDDPLLAENEPGTSPHSQTYEIDLRGVKKTFTAEWLVTDTSDDLKQIEITIKYTLRGDQYSNSAVVFRSNSS